MTEREKAERRVVWRFAGNHMTTLRSALDPPALTCIHVIGRIAREHEIQTYDWIYAIWSSPEANLRKNLRCY